MILHDELIQQYLQDIPLEKRLYPKYPKELDSSFSKNRKEVVKALSAYVKERLSSNHIFNLSLALKLMPQLDIFISKLHIYMVLGAPQGYTFYILKDKEGNDAIYIDLLRIADETPILKEMQYLLMHEITRIVIQKYLTQNKPQLKQFQHQLNYLFLTAGLSNYLSWNNSYEAYRLQDKKYEERRSKAFALLYHAYQETNETAQKQILSYLKKCEFWNSFPSVAGMFFIDDVLHEHDPSFLKQLLDTKGSQLISYIFEES